VGLADKYISEMPEQFDLASILEPDVEMIESNHYAADVIYKYFPAARKSFFSKPQLRFSQWDALNDPFEMSRRWKDARAIGLRSYVQTGLEYLIPRLFNDHEVLFERLIEQGEQELGRELTLSEKLQMNSLLASPEGKTFIRAQLEQAQQIIPPLLQLIFARLELDFDSLMEDLVAKEGILSLTEDHLNEVMWAHYSSDYAGFVVGLHTAHDFFFHRDNQDRRPLLKKVIYTDDHVENFWRNPYYSFLVKNSRWQFESEWRMLKHLSDCDEELSAPLTVHLWNVDPKMIASVYFGYRYDEHARAEDIDSLRSVGAQCDFYVVQPNRKTGLLEALSI
jgi:hypothetical protein